MTTTPKSTSGKAAAKKPEGSEVKLDLSYEEARDQLEQVVRALEQQNVPLEESMQLWEKGEALARVCEEWLNGARKKLADAVAARKQEQG